MKKLLLYLAAFAFLTTSINAQLPTLWQKTLGDGNIGSWFTSNDDVTGIAYGVVGGNERIYAVTSAGGDRVVILDANTGDFVGELNTTGITGNIRNIGNVEVSEDGYIFVSNVAENDSLRIYMYEDENSAPEMIVSEFVTGRYGHELSLFGIVETNYLFFYCPSSTLGENTLKIKKNSAGTGWLIWDIDEPSMGERMSIHSRYGKYYRNANDAAISVYDTPADYLDIPVNSNVIRNFIYFGDEYYFATYAYGAGEERAYIGFFKVQDLSTGYAVSKTPSLGTNPNPLGIGDISYKQHNEGLFTIFVLSGNNGIGAFQVDLEGTTVPVVSVADIQNSPDGVSPYDEKLVNFNAVVTYIDTTNDVIYAQDGEGPWNGIQIINHLETFTGREHTFTGFIQEYNNQTRLIATNYDYQSYQPGDITPTIITSAEVNDEKYESVLIKVADGECTNANFGANGEWVINDGSGDAYVGTNIYPHQAVQNDDYSVTGYGFQDENNRWILPRSATDVEQAQAVVLSIADVMTPANGVSGDSPFLNQEVTTKGYIVGKFNNRYFIQDADSAFSGTMLIHSMGSLGSIGDFIEFTGTVLLYQGDTYIGNLSAYQAASPVGTMPAPKDLTLPEIDEQKNKYMLASIYDNTCTFHVSMADYWDVANNNEPCRVSKESYDFEPVVGNHYDITGVVANWIGQTLDSRMIYPRFDTDIVDATPPPPVLTIANIMTPENGTSGAGAYYGEKVTTSGVVTAKISSGLVIQDAGSSYSATYISNDTTSAVVGDSVSVTGWIGGFPHMQQFENCDEVVVISSGSNGPTPKAGHIRYLYGQENHFMLFTITGAECYSDSSGWNKWGIRDYLDSMDVETRIFDFDPVVGNFYDITGPVRISNDDRVIWPRTAADVADGVNPVPEVSISQIQTTSNAQEGPSPYEGLRVKTAGTVSAIHENSFFLTGGSFVWNSIFVSNVDPNAMPAVGDIINVTGLVTETDFVTQIDDPQIELIVSGGQVPAPIDLSILEASHEGYEGALVAIDSAKCVSFTDSNWTLNDGTGDIIVENRSFDYTPILDQYYNVKANVYGGSGVKSIVCRDSSDIELMYINPDPVELAGWFEAIVGSYSFMQNDNSTRGMAFNNTNNHLYIASRTGSAAIYIIDGATGDSLGVFDMTGVAGGTYPLNILGVTEDGVIYAANLALSGNNFKIYRWADENAVPTVAYDEAVTVRLGDSFLAHGSGTSTTLYASGSGSDVVKIYTTSDGLTFTETGELPVAGGAARGGIAPVPVTKSMRYWINGAGTPLTLIDDAGNVLYEFDAALLSSAYHSVCYLKHTNGNEYVGVAGGNSDPASLTAEVWDVTDLNNPFLFTSGSLTGPFNANPNGTGMIQLTENSAGEIVIHHLVTNNGFAAYGESEYVDPNPVLYVPANVYAESQGADVKVTWNGTGADESHLISINSGIATSGFFQNPGKGYGSMFDLSELSNPVLKHVEFAHGGFNFFDTEGKYIIHVYDMDAQTEIFTSDTMTTMVPYEGAKWESIDLGDLAGVEALGVFVEAFALDGSGNVWPTVFTDDKVPAVQGGQIIINDVTDPFNNLQEPGNDSMGSFLIDLYVTYDGGAKHVKGLVANNSGKVESAEGRNLKPFNASQQNIKSFITSYNVYRGTDVNSMQLLTTVGKDVNTYVDESVAGGTYLYGVTAQYTDLESEMAVYEVIHNPVGVEDEAGVPKEFALAQNFPNPFNPSTAIKFSIPEVATVKITIVNILGEMVAELVNDVKEAGFYQVQFNASSISSGIYFYTIESKAIDSGKEFRQVKKMILMK